MSEVNAEYSAEERRWLLRLAHQSIREAVCQSRRTKQYPDLSNSGAGAGHAHLKELRGAFVTLHENGALRGCIGMVMAVQPLDETVREMARAAAVEDSRFDPVTEAELEKLQLEISVLSPMFEIAPEDVVVGRHGLMVSYGGRRGLLLPQVAPEWGWDRETLLAQTCHKAGLPAEQWKHGATLEAFTAEVFGEAEPGESLRG
ncbi:MAG: AmmeMemoRadiSam system protein A [Candidatus Korobacteraceae bacterium]|jgi:AmmeMemoRadiSam system protein A